MKKKTCSFCGRGEDQVKLLITGIDGFICEDCAKQAYKISEQAGAYGNGQYESEPYRPKKDVPKPVEILTSMSSARMRLSDTSPWPCTTTTSVCNSPRPTTALR